MRPTLVGVLVMAFGAAAIAAGRQAPAPAAAAPLTMGRLAALRARAEAELPSALKTGATSADPGVRAVAARIVALSRIAPLGGEIGAALARETEPRVAFEQLRALLLIGGAESLAAIEAHLAKEQPLGLGAYATWLAHVRPERLVKEVAWLRPRMSSELGELTAAVRMAIEQHPEMREDLTLAGGDLLAPLPGPLSDIKLSPVRTVDVIWPGFVSSLLTETGCPQASDWKAGVIQVSYAPDGVPITGGFEVVSLPAGCQAALKALVGVTIGDGAIVPNQTQIVMLPAQESVVQCLDSAVARATPPVKPGAGSRIQEPRLLTPTIKPLYPAEAKNGRIQGLVIIDATIGTNGCVRNARVIRSVSPLLDLSAMQAVAQWRYSPTLLDGQPVEVLLNVTVNFALQ